MPDASPLPANPMAQRLAASREQDRMAPLAEAAFFAGDLPALLALGEQGLDLREVQVKNPSPKGDHTFITLVHLLDAALIAGKPDVLEALLRDHPRPFVACPQPVLYALGHGDFGSLQVLFDHDSGWLFRPGNFQSPSMNWREITPFTLAVNKRDPKGMAELCRMAGELRGSPFEDFAREELAKSCELVNRWLRSETNADLLDIKSSLMRARDALDPVQTPRFALEIFRQMEAIRAELARQGYAIKEQTARIDRMRPNRAAPPASDAQEPQPERPRSAPRTSP